MAAVDTKLWFEAEEDENGSRSGHRRGRQMTPERNWAESS